jgi:hypothetical protein
MMKAIQVRGQPGQQQQQQATSGRRGWGPQAVGPAADLIDTSAQQQVAALGALVAALLQLQVGPTCLWAAGSTQAALLLCCKHTATGTSVALGIHVQHQLFGAPLDAAVACAALIEEACVPTHAA